MKKIINIMVIAILLLPYLIIPINVSGKTLGDLKRELADLEKEAATRKEEKKLTDQQIIDSNNKVRNIRNSIEQTNKEIIKLAEEIEQLNVDIKSKEEEIKDIINFLQVSNGESMYLEYAFGAQSFTDFIYRAAVAEQLTKYNDDLINKFNQMIVDNKEKTVEQKQKQTNLNNQQNELLVQINLLGKKSESLAEEGATIEEDLKAKREVIKGYQELGCTDNDDIDVCTQNLLLPTTELYRPVADAYITSRYGWRTFTLNGGRVTDFHYGIDLARNGDVPVYSAGTGMVIHTTRWDCGGNIVIIGHVVKGIKYSTVYMHLKTIAVKKNQAVTKDTFIGYMGGAPNMGDSCTTGQHLHFGMATGHYYRDYDYYSTYISRNVNPESVINFPANSNWVASRLIEY